MGKVIPKIHILRDKGQAIFCQELAYGMVRGNYSQAESFEDFIKQDLNKVDFKKYCINCLKNLRADIISKRLEEKRELNDLYLEQNKQKVKAVLLNKPFDEKDLIVKPRVTPLNLDNNETMIKILNELDGNTDDKKEGYLNLSDNENKLLSQVSGHKDI